VWFWSFDLNRVLIVGSAPNALMIKEWELDWFSHVVVLNNAWRISDQWTHLIFPDDFPPENLPREGMEGKTFIRSADYVPSQNVYGGVLMAGGTMAFTAGYWVLDALRPDLIAYAGCNMVYGASAKTHFYGTGQADPLRADPSLQSLEAKSTRLEACASLQGCAVLNLSQGPSRLTYRQVAFDDLGSTGFEPRGFQVEEVNAVFEQERATNYTFSDGKYWESSAEIDWDVLRQIDNSWEQVGALHEASGG
jgi:hypothetical protein